MSYKESWLWKRAFVDPRDDSSATEQAWFLQRYEAMRAKAEYLVSRIAKDLNAMTVHDVTHLDALWEMGSIVTEGKLDLNPPEAFVYGGAILLHDAAMTLAAYPEGLSGLKAEVAWQDSYARLKTRFSDDEPTPDSFIQELATAEALRTLHAIQAERLPAISWSDGDGRDEYLIDDLEVRRFYGPSIGKIAHSHWWSINRVEDELSNDLGPMGGRTKNPIDLIKIACLLRVSDAIHLDRRRAPEFLRKLVKPEGVSAAHWEFQGRMAVPFIRNDALVFSASPAFELAAAEAWWIAFDAVEMVDRELRAVDRLLQRRRTTRLLASRAEGANSPQELAHHLETDGWTPVDSTVRVSDVPKIVATLGGSKLYGSRPIAALRELIQNAADAVMARRRLQNRSADWGEITIAIENRDDADWLIVEDTGIGMSSTVLTGPLIDFGNSLWRSPLAAEEFPGLQAAGITATGRFGIGFFSVFMLGDHIRVTSRRYDKASNSGQTLEFLHGLNSRPILYDAGNDGPVDGGTRVEVKLSKDPRAKGGLLHVDRWRSAVIKLQYLVAATAPSLSVKLISVEEGARTVAIEPEDWLGLEESRLLNRLSSHEYELDEEAEDDDNSRLRQIIGKDGEIYGRARIETAAWGSSSQGCVSIGGLRALDVSFFCGVIAGSESTAARDDAVIAAPADALASWATEQARLIGEADYDGEDQARGAMVVLLCGGDVGDLPIARLDGRWLSSAELINELKGRDLIKIHVGSEASYDEDLDDVLPRDFKQDFTDAPDVLFVPDRLPGFSRDRRADLLPTIADSSRPRTLEDLVRNLIGMIWPQAGDEKTETVIGRVGYDDIIREVLQIRRIGVEEQELEQEQ